MIVISFTEWHINNYNHQDKYYRILATQIHVFWMSVIPPKVGTLAFYLLH